MEHAMQPKRSQRVEDVFSTDLFEGDDELAPVAGLRNAILLGAGVWIVILWSVFRFAL